MTIIDTQRDANGFEARVEIHGGIHDGAASVMRRDRIAVVGSADDCDLFLADSGIAGHHLAIGSNGNGFVARPMDGHCTINGKVLRAGQSVPIEYGDRIELGEADVCLAMTDIRKPAEFVELCNTGRSRSKLRLYACSVLLALGSVVASQQLLPTGAAATDLFEDVEQIVESLKISKEVVLSRKDDIVMIRGVLPDTQFAAFEAALLPLSRDIVNRTQSVSLLLEQVRSVFRTNGYHAELEYVNDGAVRVTNLDGDNPKIQQIAGRARDDVPVLVSLTFLPISDSAGSDRQFAIYSTDPSKRLTTIIDGDTAYVATTDGGRYFVGSVLPGGLVLREISAEGIQVDDNGQIHWLSL